LKKKEKEKKKKKKKKIEKLSHHILFLIIRELLKIIKITS